MHSLQSIICCRFLSFQFNLHGYFGYLLKKCEQLYTTFLNTAQKGLTLNLELTKISKIE
ncbi:unnamed protein product [Brugia timori]|uniref:Uncharacterized protein n=1 Tax=Brugia timori TaxID=42155 RepID=A0A0R3R9K7_9BILA|nr:unnamed protein product [Brugia timori]